MDEQFIRRIEDSFNLLAPRGEELVDRFYANLFARNPELRPLFPPDMKNQKGKPATTGATSLTATGPRPSILWARS